MLDKLRAHQTLINYSVSKIERLQNENCRLQKVINARDLEIANLKRKIKELEE